MYKCLECGHIFDIGEEAHWEENHGLDCGPYEEWTGCPLCNGSYEETVRCKQCQGEFLEDELTEGLCEECIMNSLDVEMFKKYLIDTDQISTFMFYLCGTSEPKTITKKLKRLLIKAYNMECNIKGFTNKVFSFVFQGGKYSLENYAEWLANREEV